MGHIDRSAIRLLCLITCEAECVHPHNRVSLRTRSRVSRRVYRECASGMRFVVSRPVAWKRDEREGNVSSIDIRALTPVGAGTRCPVCRDTDVRWFGILRICAACRRRFHWRDAGADVAQGA